jgi:hypothetical protein
MLATLLLAQLTIVGLICNGRCGGIGSFLTICLGIIVFDIAVVVAILALLLIWIF